MELESPALTRDMVLMAFSSCAGQPRPCPEPREGLV